MLERLRAARKNQNGFTLIELLIVIVILGVLAGVVVLAVNGINNRGVEAACDADKRTVMTAVEAHFATKAAYPAGADDAARLGALVTAGLLKEVPSKTNGYVILLDGTGGVTAVKANSSGVPNTPAVAAC